MAASTLFTLTYCSQNLIGGSPAEINAHIEAILQSARRDNRLRNVTGALLYSDGCFAQALEGERADVEAIFARIENDTRHEAVTVIAREEVPSRSFGDWSMAFTGIYGVSTEPGTGSAGMQAVDDIVATEAGRKLLASLQDVVYQNELRRMAQRSKSAPA